jgi:hypothetical protein
MRPSRTVAGGVICVVAGICSLLPAAAQRPRTNEHAPRHVGDQAALAPRAEDEPRVECANLIYAGTMSSKCFSDKFLNAINRETNIRAEQKFRPTKLASDEIFDYPFAIMTGEGVFALHEQERINLRSYLIRGGFLLASAGCSSQEWDRAFRQEMRRVFPEHEMKTIPMDHELFRTVFDINRVALKKSQGTARLEGLEIDGRIVMIYSPEGLNDTGNAGGGCCCCGGNEVQNSQEINVNVFTYALTH